MKDHEYLRTSDLARASGLGVQMIRNYEQAGFLPRAERAANGYRQYTALHLQALHTARTMIGGYSWQGAIGVMQALHRGDLAAACALVDSRHAVLHEQRRELEATLEALRSLSALEQNAAQHLLARQTDLRVGEVARRAGVQVSAVHFWESQGLIQPARDVANSYRRYSEAQARQVQIIALLRQGGYSAATIRPILDALAAGRTATAIVAAERRLHDLASASQRYAEATARFWEYASAFQARAAHAASTDNTDCTDDA